MDDPMVGHEGFISFWTDDEGGGDSEFSVCCQCGWEQVLSGPIHPSDPLRVWNGHAWRVTLGIESEE